MVTEEAELPLTQKSSCLIYETNRAQSPKPTLNYQRLFEIKCFSFEQMIVKIFETILDRISLRKFWQSDAEDKHFRQKLHLVI